MAKQDKGDRFARRETLQDRIKLLETWLADTKIELTKLEVFMYRRDEISEEEWQRS